MHAAKVSASTAGLWNLENDQYLIGKNEFKLLFHGPLAE